MNSKVGRIVIESLIEICELGDLDVAHADRPDTIIFGTNSVIESYLIVRLCLTLEKTLLNEMGLVVDCFALLFESTEKSIDVEQLIKMLEKRCAV